MIGLQLASARSGVIQFVRWSEADTSRGRLQGDGDQFREVGEYPQFEIDQSALARAGLGASLQLLKPAIPVEDEKVP